MELKDAHVLVTGASRGIGAAICRELHARGAKLTLVARDAQKLQELADELGGANVLPADLIDPEALGTLIARAEQTGGPVDAIQIECNYAGVRDTPAARTAFAEAFVTAALAYLDDHYGWGPA